MNGKKRLLLLMATMLFIVGIVVTVALTVLYNTAFEQQRALLLETVQSQARLMETVAKQERKTQQLRDNISQFDPYEATIRQLQDAHMDYEVFAKTLEFTLAKLKADEIIFLLYHHHHDSGPIGSVPFHSEFAEPMRRALKGESGTIVGLDYSGERVLAAYEPVAELNLGVVAKIDLKEIRAPYLKAGTMAGGIMIFLVIIGAIFFYRVGQPMISDLKESEERYRFLVETMNNGLSVFDNNGIIKFVNDKFCEISGYPKDELIGLQSSDLFDNHNLEIFKDHFDFRRESGSESFEITLTGNYGKKIPVIVSPKPMHDSYGELVGSFAVITVFTEQKRVLDALKESEEFSRAVIENSPLGISIRSPQGKLLSVNDAWKKIWCVSDETVREYMSAEHPKLVFDERDSYLGDWLPRVEKVYKEGGKLLIPELFLSKHRSVKPRWVTQMFYSIKNNEGQVERVVILTNDITERKLAEKALVDSRDKYQSLFENMVQGAFYQRFDGTLIDVNKAALEMFGLTKDKFLGRDSLYPKWKVVHEDGSEFAGQEHPSMIALRTGKEVKNVVVGVFNPIDNDYRWLSINAIPRFHANEEKPSEVFVTLHDITERKRSEENLRFLSQITEQVTDSIITTNLNYEITYSNRAFQQLYGYADDEILGISPDILNAESNSEKIQNDIYQTISSGNVWSGEVLNRKKDGAIFPCELTVYPLHNDKGEIYAYAGNQRDITERKRVEDEIGEKIRTNQILLDAFPCIAVLLRPHSREIVACNRMAVEVGAILGKTCYETWAQREDPCPWCQAPELWITGKAQKCEPTYKGITWDAHWMPVSDDLYMHFAFDITEHKQAEENLKKIEWMLAKDGNRLSCDIDRTSRFCQPYGDLTELNTEKFIRDSVGKNLLSEIAGDYLDLLDSSGAIYESNGDYALGIFSSKWCQLLDEASRKLCDTHDNKKALNCGKWLCHESCWGRASQVAIQGSEPVDIECSGGIGIYAVPIRAGEKIIGSMNFGYGDPPRDPQKIQQISKEYGIDQKLLVEVAESYASRPAFIIETAKARLLTSAKLIGEIVERKQAERLLYESEEKYRQLFTAETDAILVFDAETFQMIDINEAAIALYGYSKEEFLKLKLMDISAEEKKTRESVTRTRNGNTENIPIRYHKKKNGDIFPVEISPGSFTLGNRRVLCGIIRDITDRKRMEEEMIKREKLESISILAGGIAHDFNNILTGIAGNISLAKMEMGDNEESTRDLEEAERALERACDLTHQLLTFSKGGEPVKKIVSLPEIIKESSRFVLSGSNVKSELVLSDETYYSEVDSGQISQVFNNLIINADQAMPEGGIIEIKCEHVIINEEFRSGLKQEKYVKISIKDHGIGISKEHLSRIFDPFFTTKQKGSGLGLTSAYSIVNKHGGFIECESKLGVETVFCVYLPETDKSPSLLLEISEDPVSGTGRVLIMDDDDMIKTVIKKAMSRMGYKIVYASNGHEAIEKYRAGFESNEPFDVAVLDLTIPGGMGGKETVQELLKIDPRVKAIVSSGYSNDHVMANYRDYGFKSIVTKPYKPHELGRAIKQLMEAEIDKAETVAKVIQE